MEIEGQQVQRRCFRREPMRKPTQPQREQANPEGPLRLAPFPRQQRTANGTLSGGSQVFTPLGKTQTLRPVPQASCGHHQPPS
jgi:hypothetical protein